MRAEDVLHRFPYHKSYGKWYLLNCPLHEDGRASLAISTFYYKDGSTGISCKCFAGCDSKALKEWLGSSESILDKDFDSSSKSKKRLNIKYEFVASYPYYDSDGVLVYEVVRFKPKKFSQRRRDTNGNYVWGITSGHYYQGNNGQWYKCHDEDIKKYKKVKFFKEVNPMLYNLNEVRAGLKINPEARVFIVGGEKDVETLKANRFLAITNSGGEGADRWLDEFSESLKDLNVVMLPDNDLTGYDHLYRVADSLIPYCKSFKAISLPNLKEHEDVSDWFTKYGGTSVQLKNLVNKALDYKHNPERLREDLKFSLEPKPVEHISFIESLTEEANQLSKTLDLSKLGLCPDCLGTGYLCSLDEKGFPIFSGSRTEKHVAAETCPCSAEQPRNSVFTAQNDSEDDDPSDF